MTTRAGVAKTAKEAIICKSSSSLLGNDCGGLQKQRMGDGDGFKCRRQSPLLNRIYHSRNQVIHKMVASCLRTLQSHGSDAVLGEFHTQLLLLGAGVDVTFEKLYSNSAKIFAVDYPEIMLERKTALSGIQFDKDSGINESSLESNSSSLISADLCDFDDVWMKLSRSGFNAEYSAIVLIECVLCYIDSLSVQKLLKQLSNHLPPQSILITYDPMVPKPSINSNLSNLSVRRSDFTQMVADKFTERNAPILHNIKSIEMQETFKKFCGWQYVTAMNMYTASRLILTPEERKIPISAEPFDEFASLAILHKLYNVTLSSLSEQLFLSCLSDLKLDKDTGKRSIEAPQSIDASVHCVNNHSSATAATVGRTSQSSQAANADDSLDRLLGRIATAELRVQSLIFR
jgi:O-methyltransferase involved in polyketide biosynthesis